MKLSQACFSAALVPVFALAAFAQAPAPPPDAPSTPTTAPAPPPQSPNAGAPQVGTSATRSSRVSAVVRGPQGEIQAITLKNGAAVTFSPDLSARLRGNITKNTRVQVSGNEQTIDGQTTLIAQSITANGQTYAANPTIAGQAPPPPPPGGPAARRGPRGRVAAPPPADGAAPPPPPPDGMAPPPPPPAGGPPPAPPM